VHVVARGRKNNTQQKTGRERKNSCCDMEFCSFCGINLGREERKIMVNSRLRVDSGNYVKLTQHLFGYQFLVCLDTLSQDHIVWLLGTLHLPGYCLVSSL
jgi:hypothetical protein